MTGDRLTTRKFAFAWFAAAAVLAGFVLEAFPAEEPAPPAGSVTPGQLKSEIERLQRDIEAKRDSSQAPEAWKKLRQAEARLEKARAASRKEADGIREEISKLTVNPAAARWGNDIDHMQRRLQELEIEDWKLTKNDGLRLFQARHAELSKFAPAATPKLHSLGFDVLNYPRMDGSTSCQPLAAVIACRCFGARPGWVGKAQRRWRDPNDDESLGVAALFGRSEPELELLEFTLQAQASEPAEQRLALIINRFLAHNASTHQAYVNLIEGRSEIGLLARAPAPDELELARTQNVDLDVVPCALDAFVFLVNTENPVRNLTTSQIRDIYAGKIEDWKKVGGRQRGITAYQREENSGSQQLMRQLVMKDIPFKKPTEHYARVPQLVGHLMSSVYLELTSDKGGLAYSVYYYERFMSGSPRTRTIAVDGAEPTFDTIRQRKYPYTTEVFAVTRKGIDPQAPAARLRDWLLSAEGQSVVRESGYVPLTTNNDDP